MDLVNISLSFAPNVAPGCIRMNTNEVAMKPANGRLVRALRRMASRPLVPGVMLIMGVLALVSSALYDSRRDAWERVSEASANLARALERDLASEIKAIDLTLGAVVNVMTYGGSEGISPEIRRNVISERISAVRYLNAVLMIDENGEVAFDTRTRSSPVVVNFSDRDYFIVHRAKPDVGFFVSKPFRSRLADGMWSVGFSRRLSHPDGSFAGVVLGVIRLEHLEGAFAGLNLGPGGSMTLFRSDGIILTRSPKDERQFGRDLSGAPAFLQTRKAVSGQFTAIAVIDGIERFYSYRQIAGAPLTINVATSVEEIYAAWWHKSIVIGIVTALLSTAMLFLLVLLHRELSRRASTELAARNSEATFRLLAEHSSDIVSRIDSSGLRLYVSPAAEAVFGLSTSELIGRSVLDNVLPDDLSIVQDAVAKLEKGGDVITSYRIQRPDGGIVWMEASARSVWDEQTGKTNGIVAIARDVTDRKAAEEKLALLARTDGLTGLVNRRTFDDTFEREWRRARREGTTLSLLLLDVDRFKLFNDTYGHPQGDTCLRKVAGAVAASVRRPGDLVARYGGEEIAVILPNTSSEGAEILAQEIRSSVEAIRLSHVANLPFSVVTVSIGSASVEPAVAIDVLPEALLAAADEALYRAKRGGRNRVVCSHSVPPPATLPPIPSDEEARLVALSSYKESLSAPETSLELDRIVRLAARMIGAPVSLVSLVEGESQKFAAHFGLDAESTPRNVSFCAHLVASEADILVVPDAAADARFSANPLVIGAPNIRFYAGAPLICPRTSHRLGALCSIDHVPRSGLNPAQRAILVDLASMVMDVLERHRTIPA